MEKSVLERLEYVGRRDSLLVLENEMNKRFGDTYTTIVETGTTRKPIDDELKGDGGSTLFFCEWLKNHPDGGVIHTVDIDEACLNNCREITKNYKRVCYHHRCSLDFLKGANFEVDVLYLDSYDSNPQTQKEASAHQIEEIARGISLLHFNSLILLDDVGVNFKGGKGDLSVPFLMGTGWKIINHSEASNQLLFSRS